MRRASTQVTLFTVDPKLTLDFADEAYVASWETGILLASVPCRLPSSSVFKRRLRSVRPPGSSVLIAGKKSLVAPRAISEPILSSLAATCAASLGFVRICIMARRWVRRSETHLSR
jgi:hypothetical protein